MAGFPPCAHPDPGGTVDEAVGLAERQGMYKTARALRLDYGALKKRAN